MAVLYSYRPYISSPDSPTNQMLSSAYMDRSRDCPSNNRDCLSNNRDCPSNNRDCPSNNRDCPSNNRDCPSINRDCPSINRDCPSNNRDCPRVPQSDHRSCSNDHRTFSSDPRTFVNDPRSLPSEPRPFQSQPRSESTFRTLPRCLADSHCSSTGRDRLGKEDASTVQYNLRKCLEHPSQHCQLICCTVTGSTGGEVRPRCSSQASASSTLTTRGSILNRSYR